MTDATAHHQARRTKNESRDLAPCGRDCQKCQQRECYAKNFDSADSRAENRRDEIAA